MAERPLLLFPQARKQLPAKGRGFPPSQVAKPGVTNQKKRLGPAFQKLEDAFDAKRAELSASASGMEPEKVLVIETADAVSDFQRAVRSIPGMEWLGEFELDDTEPDENFHFADKPDKQTPRVIYLAMTNQRAIEQIIGLWNLWEADKQKFPRGKTKWRDLFSLCRTIRYWNTDDRLSGTGLIEALRDALLDASQSISMEIEFWHRSKARLQASKGGVINQLREAGGKVVSEAISMRLVTAPSRQAFLLSWRDRSLAATPRTTRTSLRMMPFIACARKGNALSVFKILKNLGVLPTVRYRQNRLWSPYLTGPLFSVTDA